MVTIFTFISLTVIPPIACAHARLLNPCFKTGSKTLNCCAFNFPAPSRATRPCIPNAATWGVRTFGRKSVANNALYTREITGQRHRVHKANFSVSPGKRGNPLLSDSYQKANLSFNSEFSQVRCVKPSFQSPFHFSIKVLVYYRSLMFTEPLAAFTTTSAICLQRSQLSNKTQSLGCL